MLIARIAVEFLGAIPLQEMSVRTRITRPGRRIELVEGAIESKGREVVSARIWRIATQKDSVPNVATKRKAIPPLPPEQPQRHFPGLADWGYGEAIEWRFTRGGYDTPGPAEVWTKVRLPLIADEPAQPIDRLLVVADSANGLSAELPLHEWLFVPPSVSIALLRYPEGEWTFMGAQTTLGRDGIGITTADLADQHGFLGVLSQALLVERRAQQ
jgi:hypothetical protein